VLTYTDIGLINGQTYYYKVSAINSVGEGAQSNELSAKPIGPPASPQNLQAISGDTFIELTWQAPSSDGGSSIIAYKIYRGDTSGGEAFHTILGHVLTYTDIGLINGQTYSYKVSAINFVGEGAQSNELSANSIGPPTAPQNLQGFSGDAYVNLTWTAPSSDGGSPIIRYQVWRGTTAGEETFLANAGPLLWYNNTGLINGQTYYYKVNAVNSVGEGGLSNEVSSTPTTVPTEPILVSATSGNVQVVLTWIPPSSDGGSAITAYVVYRGETSGGEIFLTTLGDVLTYTDIGLTNGQTYYYKVGAVNSVGEGAPSNEVSATPATVPTLPVTLVAAPGNSQVVLTWSAPSSDGGSSITAYKVYRGTMSGGEVLLTTLGNVLTYTDPELTNGQIYYYKVSAVNSAGEGPQSVEVLAKPITVPSAPTISTTTAGDAQVVLNWTAPTSNGGSSIVAYKVYRGTVSGDETLLATLGNVLSFTDTGLTNGQTYYYKVSAANSVGESVLSQEATATPAAPTPTSNNDWVWIVIAILVIIAVCVAIVLYMRSKA
jgi:predicted phage tail protein